MEEEQIGLRQDLDETQAANTAAEEELVETQVHVHFLLGTYTSAPLCVCVCVCVRVCVCVCEPIAVQQLVSRDSGLVHNESRISF